MEDLKQKIIRDILSRCSAWATIEQRQLIESAVVLALADMKVEKEETALSTEFAEPNESYVRTFITIKAIKGLSPKTLHAYKYDIERFLEFIQKPVPTITTNDVRYYLAKRMQDGCTNVTVDNTRRYLKSFFETLHKEKLIQDNPVSYIDEIKKEKKVREPFSEDEMEALRDACETERDRAIVETLFSTCCRVGELVSMDRGKIKDDTIVVHGKGNKERTVYLNAKAKRALEKYLAARTDTNEALFVSERKPCARLTESAIETIVRELGQRAGVANCHPHRFRRTAATVALNRGMPIDQVSQMLGHEKLTTTQIYAKTNTEDVRHNHRKYLA